MPLCTISIQLASPPSSCTAATGPSVRNNPAMKCHTPCPSTHAMNHGRSLISRHPSTRSLPNEEAAPRPTSRLADAADVRRGPDVRAPGEAVWIPPRVSAEQANSAAVSAAAQPGPAASVTAPASAGATTADRLVATPIRAFIRNRSGPGTTATTSLGTAGLPNAMAAPATADNSARSRRRFLRATARRLWPLATGIGSGRRAT